MQRHDRVGNEIDWHDVETIGRAERQHRQAGKEYKGAGHVELGCLGALAVAQDDARPKERARDVWKKFSDHVLTKFFGARVRIVIAAVPINGSVFLHYFVGSLSRNGDGADVAEATQSMVLVGMHGKLDNLQRAAQVGVETGSFGLAIQ